MHHAERGRCRHQEPHVLTQQRDMPMEARCSPLHVAQAALGALSAAWQAFLTVCNSYRLSHTSCPGGNNLCDQPLQAMHPKTKNIWLQLLPGSMHPAQLLCN